MPNLPYKTAGWDTHSEVKLREIDYPLEGEPAHFTVLRTYEGPEATYVPLALDSADAEFAAAKFVRQGRLVDIGGGCVRYDRLFATVPASWNEPESYAYTFPALEAGTSGSSSTVTGIAAGGTANTVDITTALTGISVGDTVVASVRYTRSTIVYNQTFNAKVSAVGSGTVTIPGNLLGSGIISGVSGTIAERVVGRAAASTKVADGRVQYDYALSSLGALPADLPIFQPFQPVLASTAMETDTLSTGTIPTAAAYFDLMQSKGELVVECSRRRYIGNIYERRTRFVTAL